ncbi:MAG: hypothetical protein PHF44_02515 [Candidatus Pacebacteria bacterium]|nr:hypothetical protein [Candidatus Paceibacterota bacterium]
MKTLIIVLHSFIIFLSFGSFALALRIWKNYQKKTGEPISESWKFFTFGLFFIGLAEILDIFTPIYEQLIAAINFYAEVTETAALAFLFLGIIIFLRKRITKADSV